MYHLTYDKDILLSFVTAILSPEELTPTEAINLYYHGDKGQAEYTLRGRDSKRKIEIKRTEGIRKYQKQNMLYINLLRYKGFTKSEILLITGNTRQTVNTYFDSLVEYFPNRETPLFDKSGFTYTPGKTVDAFMDYLRNAVSNDKAILGNRQKELPIYDRLKEAILRMAASGKPAERIIPILIEYLIKVYHAKEAEAYMFSHGITPEMLHDFPVENRGVPACLLLEIMGPAGYPLGEVRAA